MKNEKLQGLKDKIFALKSDASEEIGKSLNPTEKQYNKAYLAGVEEHEAFFNEQVSDEKSLGEFFLKDDSLKKSLDERRELLKQNKLGDQLERARINAKVDFFTLIENHLVS